MGATCPVQQPPILTTHILAFIFSNYDDAPLALGDLHVDLVFVLPDHCLFLFGLSGKPRLDGVRDNYFACDLGLPSTHAVGGGRSRELFEGNLYHQLGLRPMDYLALRPRALRCVAELYPSEASELAPAGSFAQSLPEGARSSF